MRVSVCVYVYLHGVDRKERVNAGTPVSNLVSFEGVCFFTCTVVPEEAATVAMIPLWCVPRTLEVVCFSFLGWAQRISLVEPFQRWM